MYLILCVGMKATCDYFNAPDLPTALAESFILLWHLPQGRLRNTNPSPPQGASSQRFYIPHQFAIRRRKKQGALKAGDLKQGIKISRLSIFQDYCPTAACDQAGSVALAQPSSQLDSAFVRAHPVYFASTLVCTRGHFPRYKKPLSLRVLEAQPSRVFGHA